MKKFRENRWLLLVVRLVIAGTFLYAGGVKIFDAKSFADGIAAFEILPNSVVSIMALGLPPFEIIIGCFLLCGYQRRAAAMAVMALTSIFILALTFAWARGLHVDCNCFGTGKAGLWSIPTALGRNIFLFAGALLVYRQSLSYGRI